MIEFKEHTLDHLKYYYDERHGFVFQAGRPFKDTSIENMCNVMIEQGITKEQPEFVTRLDPHTFVVVYAEGISFNSGEFYARAKHPMLQNVCRVDTLAAFLKGL